jgi:hypothetical protein
MHYKVLAVCGIVCAALLAGCGEGSGGSPPSQGPLPLPTPVGAMTPPANTAYLGAYVPGPMGGLAALESQVGHRLALDMHYYNWTSLFPGVAESNDISFSRTSIESWNCGISDAQVASGYADMLIASRAEAIKAFGRPVFVRFMPDANVPAGLANRTQCYDPATDESNGDFSPSEYVAAWQHIRSIFAQQNTTNAIWVWSVSAAGVDPSPYYPGDSQVDWIGMDAYDTAGTNFTTTFSSLYAKIAQHAKPVMITETAATPALQGQFLAQAVPALKAQFPLVGGLIYYDADTGAYQWQLSSDGISAFRAMAQNPYFSATPQF